MKGLNITFNQEKGELIFVLPETELVINKFLTGSNNDGDTIHIKAVFKEEIINIIKNLVGELL